MRTISYKKENCTFIHRVAVVITDKERVLLHRAETNDFWSLPGGHVELMEDSLAAIRREMREEIGEALVIDRLLWIVENLFTDGDQRYHELGLYYLAHLPETSRFLAGDGPFYGSEDFEGSQPLRLIFKWFPIDGNGLQKEVIYPVFLRKALGKFPEFPEHVLNIEEAEDSKRNRSAIFSSKK